MKSIIELAREANSKGDIDANWLIYYQAEYLTRFANLVRAEVLEEAAGAIEQTRHPWGGSPKEHYIATIRALKEKPND